MIVERVRIVGADFGTEAWPFNLPFVSQIATEGLDFTSPMTIIVGENGSGKSTLVEAIAESYGLDVRGGHGNRRYGSSLPKGALGEAVSLEYAPRSNAKRGAGFFLRAETAHGMLTAMSDLGVRGYGERHAATISHGEGYLQVLEGRFGDSGLYLLDEPESPLSFEACLALMSVLHEAMCTGAQVICATHSPVLAAMPGAQLLQISDAGIAETAWEDLAMVAHWRRYLADPGSYLRHVLS